MSQFVSTWMRYWGLTQVVGEGRRPSALQEGSLWTQRAAQLEPRAAMRDAVAVLLAQLCPEKELLQATGQQRAVPSWAGRNCLRLPPQPLLGHHGQQKWEEAETGPSSSRLASCWFKGAAVASRSDRRGLHSKQPPGIFHMFLTLECGAQHCF